MRPHGLFAVSVVVAAVHVAPRARAADRDGASAEALFVDGRAALEAGRLDEACMKLEASQRLEPAPGTLLNLADCEEKRGRIATAWEHLRHAMEILPPNDDRRGFTEKRIAALERRLPRLAVRLAPGTPAGARALRDGAELPEGAAGVLLPVNPGSHDVKLEAGGASHVTVVSLAEGESRVVVLDVASERARVGDAPPRKSVPTLALATGGGTLVALTLGVAAGLAAAGRDAAMNDHCSSDRVCDPVGIEAGREGRTYATVSTVSFVAAGVLAAATLYVVLRGR